MTFIWDPSSASMKLGMYQVILFLTNTRFCCEILKCALFPSFGKILFSFQLWLMIHLDEKKHWGLKKMANISQITFSNGFSFKKLFWLKFHNIFLAATKQLYEWFSPSVCLPVCLSGCLCLSLHLSLCLSACHTFFTVLFRRGALLIFKVICQISRSHS